MLRNKSKLIKILFIRLRKTTHIFFSRRQLESAINLQIETKERFVMFRVHSMIVLYKL